MFEPGYYKTNYRALRLRETIRWYGWRLGVREWLKTRFMRMSRAGRWMPGIWAENECKSEDLSPDFWQATKPHRADFEKLGFVQCRLSKPKRSFDTSILDNGGVFYLDPTRCHLGLLIYSRHYVPAKRKMFNRIVLAFTAVFESGSFSCTNNRLTFDSLTGGQVIRMNSYDVVEIYNRFHKDLEQRREVPRPFANVEALRQWFDARQIKNFEGHVRRRLFVPMTEAEVAAAEVERRLYPAGRALPAPRRRFKLDFLPTTLVLILLAWLIMHGYRRGPISVSENTVAAATIDYQGQQFKMSRPYAEYDDYKDDPNNLNTNELPRIEQAMEAVKIPASFKDRKAFIDFMVGDLEFPGYGSGFMGASSKSDDGSTIETAMVEIPQRDKERVVLVRKEAGDELKLVDDFIYSGADTNDITRVQLERGQLEYFNRQGRLVRKKALER